MEGGSEMSKKWTAYFYVFKLQIQKSLAYRFDVYSNVLGQCIVMFATAFFWKALYAGQESVKGVAVEDMLVYTIISSAMAMLFSINVQNRVTDSVWKGTIATDMVKPIGVFGLYFFEDLGNTIMIFFQNVIPIVLIGSIFIAVPKPDSMAAFALFVFCLMISYLINWLLAACFSTIAFVVIRVGPWGATKEHLIRLLSGSIIPMWFFPEGLRRVLEFFPFVYLYQLPLDIYIGKYDLKEYLPRIGMQLMWLLLFFLLFQYLQQKVMKHVMVQGG